MFPPELEPRLRQLLTVFLEENAKLNLSAFRKPEQCWTGNILDSMAALELPLFSSIPQHLAETAPTPIPSPVPGEGERRGVRKGREGRSYPTKGTIELARDLRKNMTKSEAMLWRMLRDHQLGVHFRRQRPVGSFVLDFYCEELRLGIEVDGGIHEMQMEQDAIRQELLEARGISFLRLTSREVEQHPENVLVKIRHALSVPPLPEGGRGAPKERGGGQRAEIFDLGTGGGFPLLPLAIALSTAEGPNVSFIGLDSVQKKVDAVIRIVEKLELKNVRCVAGRAEEFGRFPEYRERFDIVTSRAVAELNVLLEFTSPFVKPGGHIVLWKSMTMDQELQDSLLARAEFGCHLVEQHPYELPDNFGKRQLLVFEKSGSLSPKYPRGVGVPGKQPLR